MFTLSFAVTLPDDIHEDDSLIGRFAYSTDRDTVERYLDLNQRFARWIAVGVGMILGGIIPVIVLDNDLGVAIMMFFIAIGVGLVDILVVKTRPERLNEYIDQPGCYPAYHMNKKHWLTLVLDGTLPDPEIEERIQESFALTEAGGKPAKVQK